MISKNVTSSGQRRLHGLSLYTVNPSLTCQDANVSGLVSLRSPQGLIGLFQSPGMVLPHATSSILPSKSWAARSTTLSFPCALAQTTCTAPRRLMRLLLMPSWNSSATDPTGLSSTRLTKSTVRILSWRSNASKTNGVKGIKYSTWLNGLVSYWCQP